MEKPERMQWHPVFASALRLELQEYEHVLDIQEEVQLTRKPLEIDILIIRKKRDVPILKNIAEIFREHNIVEYKSPEDYFSIDDYYKVKAYAYLYKTLGREVNALPVEELTISCVCSVFPAKLADYLERVHGLELQQRHLGIYTVVNKDIAMQFVVVDELSPLENRFIRLLTRRSDVKKEIASLLEEYGGHRKDSRYEMLLDLVAETNMKQLLEVMGMSRMLKPDDEQALMEFLAKFEIDKRLREEGEERGKLEGKLETARSLLHMGMGIEIIRKATGLPEEMLAGLEAELDRGQH